MASIRTTFTLDEKLASQARSLGINISAAARQGIVDAIHEVFIHSDRQAYTRCPETIDSSWKEGEAWSEQ